MKIVKNKCLILLSWVWQVLHGNPVMAADAFNHMAHFDYDPGTTYLVEASPGVPTDIELGPDEKMQGFALGDTVQWMVEELPGHVFVKPLREKLFTAGTLVTNRRVYTLEFRSVPTSGRWVQKVSWGYGGAFRGGGSSGGPMGTWHDPSPEHISSALLNTDYRIEGDSDFRPVRVFDDGRFTWIEVQSPQALPALFMVQGDQEMLVNYLVHGHYFLVQRLMPEILLRLGKNEVRIFNNGYKR